MEQILLLTMITLVASIIQGISGFAFGIILVGVSQYILNYTTTLAFNALLSTCMLAYATYHYRKNINFCTIKYPVIAACIVVLLAQQLFSMVASFRYSKALLGTVFMLLGFYMLCSSAKITLVPSKLNGILCGTATGLLQGLFGVGGPPITMYLLATSPNKEEYFGNSQFFYLILIGVDFLGRLKNNLIPTEVLKYFPSCLLAMFIGLGIGTALVGRINMKLLQKVVHIMIILDGFYMIVYTIL